MDLLGDVLLFGLVAAEGPLLLGASLVSVGGGGGASPWWQVGSQGRRSVDRTTKPVVRATNPVVPPVAQPLEIVVPDAVARLLDDVPRETTAFMGPGDASRVLPVLDESMQSGSPHAEVPTAQDREREAQELARRAAERAEKRRRKVERDARHARQKRDRQQARTQRAIERSRRGQEQQRAVEQAREDDATLVAMMAVLATR